MHTHTHTQSLYIAIYAFCLLYSSLPFHFEWTMFLLTFAGNQHGVKGGPDPNAFKTGILNPAVEFLAHVSS